MYYSFDLAKSNMIELLKNMPDNVKFCTWLHPEKKCFVELFDDNAVSIFEENIAPLTEVESLPFDHDLMQHHSIASRNYNKRP